MIENLLAPENFLFLISLGMFLLIFLVQLVSLVCGMELFGFMDSLLPDVSFDIDSDLNIGDSTAGFLDSVMSMLKLGRVPFVFTFILFLFLFSLIGLYGQMALVESGVGRLHWFVASGTSFVITLPFLRFGNSVLEKVLPKDETAAVSSETFIGRMATIVIGVVTSERSAEAKLVGPEGKTHYIQVVADNEGKTFKQGDSVLVVGRRGDSLFTVIENKNPLLEE
ncbi:YqiJ family protein [Puniceicoccaceae bacterium K14]|nr:YqiJ family protein [Puniceicoccaceae bacterium K14]